LVDRPKVDARAVTKFRKPVARKAWHVARNAVAVETASVT
jgi:hypothetical protein